MEPATPLSLTRRWASFDGGWVASESLATNLVLVPADTQGYLTRSSAKRDRRAVADADQHRPAAANADAADSLR
jgi:hypothetical protein